MWKSVWKVETKRQICGEVLVVLVNEAPKCFREEPTDFVKPWLTIDLFLLVWSAHLVINEARFKSQFEVSS